MLSKDRAAIASESAYPLHCSQLDLIELSSWLREKH